MNEQKERVDRNVSNVKVSHNIYKQLKIMSIERETSVQKVVQDILERAVNKKNKHQEGVLEQ